MTAPTNTKTLGIIGGMGPEATVDLFRRIVAATPAQTDQEHLHILIDNDPRIEDRTAAILHPKTAPSPLPKLLRAGKRLVATGADILAMPCNTAHDWHDEISDACGVPLLHMIRLTAEAVRAEYPAAERVGLLATSGTIQTKLYTRYFAASNLRILTPNTDEQTELVMAAIYGAGGIKAGGGRGEPREKIDCVIESLREQGAEVVVLGCTELPLLFSDDETSHNNAQSIPLINPTEILAHACVAAAMQPQ